MRLGYLQLPRFPVQRRVREQPSLTGKPLVLHADDRGVQRVRFASGAALRRGIRPGMTVAAASALEPELVRLVFDPAAEAKALLSLGEALLVLAPGFQVASPDGLWLDASAAELLGAKGRGAERGAGAQSDPASPEATHKSCETRWADQVLAACRAIGLRGRCVVASERFTAQALARWSGSTRAVVEPSGGAELAKLPLTALEDGWLGLDAAGPFRALGLSTLGEVAALASGALVARFGVMGHQAARLCRGEDDSRFVPDELPELLEEKVELDWPAEHLEPLLFAVKTVVDRLCARLQGRQQAAVRLTVTLALDGATGRGRNADRQARTRSMSDRVSPGATQEDGASDMVVPLILARPSSQAKLLLELLRHRLTDLTVRNPIAALTVRVEELCADPGRQLMLGDAPAGEAELEVVLSRLQSALGEGALFSAAPVARHRPEDAWTATAFHPPDGGRISDLWGVMEADWVLGDRQEMASTEMASTELLAPRSAAPVHRPAESSSTELLAGYEGSGLPLPPKKRTKVKTQTVPQTSVATLVLRPPRLFREPTLLATELTAQGELTAVSLLGRRRKVESLWGPERLAGDWWSPEPFARDYFRVQLEGVGMLWVFRDGRDGQFYAQGVFD